MKKLRHNVEQALRKGLMTLEESRQLIDSYQTGLAGYTYLERDLRLVRSREATRETGVRSPSRVGGGAG